MIAGVMLLFVTLPASQAALADTEVAAPATVPPAGSVTSAAHPAITVRPSTSAPKVSPHVLAAYRAYRSGDAAALALYQRALRANSRDVNALLGMAALSWQQKHMAEAVGWYTAVLAEDPQNPVAQAGLITIQGELQMQGSESRIKQLLAQQPHAACLHALLGHVYAGRRQWAEARQAYFDAYRLDSTNAGHAFNLAISLDHLNRSQLALDYYRKAQALLPQYRGGHIDLARLHARIHALQQSQSGS
jgi:tetratricopeptide (TPR) repeat protein